MFREINRIRYFNQNHSQQQANGKRYNKKLYAVVAGLAIVTVLAAVLVPQGLSNPVRLGLQYTIGDHMVYDISSQITGHQVGIPSSSPTVVNSTIVLDVLSFDGENYVLNETLSSPMVNRTLPQITINISKTNYYDNFLAPGGPNVFYKADNNPTLPTYLAKSQVNIGDIWQMPISTGNESCGLTGEITIKFSGIQDLTVPAGTFKTFKIEIQADNIAIHYDSAYLRSINLAVNGNYTLSLSGTTYLEQNTCRLIKSDLTQYVTITQQSVNNGDVPTITSTTHTEKTLMYCK